MDIRQLRTFAAVVERGSFSAAADALGVTQPAVSQQIRSLERALGFEVLDRSGRRGEPLIVMQEGSGIRTVIEEELREAGVRLRDLDVEMEMGLQESAKAAVEGGHGVSFLSSLALAKELRLG